MTTDPSIKQISTIPLILLFVILTSVPLNGCLSIQHTNIPKSSDHKTSSPEVSLDVEQPTVSSPQNKNKEIGKPGPNDVERAGEKPSVTDIPEKTKSSTNSIPPINPKAPILTKLEAIRQIREMRYRDFYPIMVSGSPLMILYDLTGDGQPELFLLTVKVKNRANAKIGYLSDYARLFSENKEPIDFSLYLYGNHAGKLYLLKTYNLGKRYVFKSFEKLRLSRKNKALIAIVVGFQTQNGYEKTLLNFTGPSIKLLSRFRIKENLSTKSTLTDIDNDGVIDILVQEKAMEEGVGYETFLTWYRWQGYRFVEYKSTNVVRNLRIFLENVKRMLINGKYRELLNYAVDKKIISKLKKEGENNTNLLFRILGFDTFFDPSISNPKTLFSNINDVTFPEILEDPFTKQEDGNWGFKISYRVSIQNGISFIAESKILMMRNPFGKRQFSFTLLRK